jgi:hypothetical protein
MLLVMVISAEMIADLHGLPTIGNEHAVLHLLEASQLQHSDPQATMHWLAT